MRVPFCRVAGAVAAVVLGGLTAIGAGAAEAGEVRAGKLIIEAPWTRATPGGAKIGAGYLSIINSGTEPDRLTSASSPFAERVEIHLMTMAGGIMRMRRLSDGLVVEPRAVIELRPGGQHLMLIGLKGAIREGDTVPVTVVFERAGAAVLKLEAAAIGATVAPNRSEPGPAGGSNSGNGVSQRGNEATMGEQRDMRKSPVSGSN